MTDRERRGRTRILGLTVKLLTGILLAQLVGVAALATVSIRKLRGSLEGEVQSKAEAIGRSLAAGTTESLTVLVSNPDKMQTESAVSTMQGFVDYSKGISGICYIYVESASGAVLAHTFKSFPAGLEKTNLLADQQDLRVAPEVVWQAASCQGAIGSIRAIDVGTAVSGGSLGWVHVGMDLAAIDAQVSGLKQSMFMFATLFMLVTALGAVGTVLVFVTRPIAELTRVTGAIVRGDLTQDVQVRSGDEIGDLAAIFGEMVKKLRTIPAALQLSVTDLRKAVDGLSELTRDQAAIVQQQATGISEASVTTEEIKQTSSMAASKADTVLKVAAEAEEFSGAGQNAVDASLKGLEDIRHQIESMVERITNLTERMLQVGEILDKVNDIANQSNVLALNAAIEASKAGEFGKGFSVLAREIRSLADQSKQSTERIREILAEIQSAIRSTVNITESGKAQMQQSMTEIQSSGESLRRVTAIVHQSSQAARQIAASVSQQNAGISQISAAIGSMKSAMDGTVTGIASTEKAAEDLRSIAGRIGEIVSAFRL